MSTEAQDGSLAWAHEMLRDPQNVVSRQRDCYEYRRQADVVMCRESTDETWEVFCHYDDFTDGWSPYCQSGWYLERRQRPKCTGGKLVYVGTSNHGTAIGRVIGVSAPGVVDVMLVQTADEVAPISNKDLVDISRIARRVLGPPMVCSACQDGPPTDGELCPPCRDEWLNGPFEDYESWKRFRRGLTAQKLAQSTNR